MKVLLNKLKKANKILLFIWLIVLILYGVSYGFLVKNLLGLSGIENVIRLIVIVLFGVWLITYFLWNLINLVIKKKVAIIVTTIFTIIFTVVFSVANYYIEMIYKGIGNLAESTYVNYTTNLVVLGNNKIDEKSKLGMINNSSDVEGNVLAKELIDKEKLNNEVVNYSSYYEMIYDLLNGKVEGIFLNSNYLTIFSDEEFEGLKNTSIQFTYSKKMKNQDTEIVSTKKLTEPFTVLLMGVDSDSNGLDASSSFNGDTLMLITFNPKTLNATMFSIPRDTYVPITCNNNRYAKINSAAAYGTNCVISTIEALTDIKIDYYVKINFKGVVDLVEVLDGLDVEVEAPDYKPYYKTYNGRICEQDSLRQFGENLVCMDSGMQHLNGEQVLAYARCRHAYLLSDIARNKHQQQIVEALARKVASPSNIKKIEDLLNAVTNNMATNMSKEQILSFYEVMKNMVSKSFKDGDFISIQKTYLEYYNLNVRVSNNGLLLSAIGHYPGSLEQIVKLMKTNLGLEAKKEIKTFSFDFKEDYVSKVTGQGITTGTKLETVPNFVGFTKSDVEAWASARNITVKTEFVDSSSEYYDPEMIPGFIAAQSVSNGILVNNVKEITVYINQASNRPNPGNNDDDNNDQDDDNQDDSNDLDLPDVIFPGID